MRIVDVNEIKEIVAKLCQDINYCIAEDIDKALKDAIEIEEEFLAIDTLKLLRENAKVAAKEKIPTCQDTGMVVVFLDIGQEVQLTGGSVEKAINKGVSKGYTEGYLRKSVVNDPIRRKNTEDNTPAVIYYNIVDGDKVRIRVTAKGFGSENMSRLVMLKPAQGIEAIKDFVIETVKIAGPNACPPVILGVGIGGTMDKAALMAKEALLRDVASKNPDKLLDDLEEEILQKVNDLNIGPAGLKGKTTALAVHINTYATHIAGLPLAVNVGCHATRHKEEII